MRYAVTYGSNGAAFTFDATMSGQTIVLTSGPLLLTNNITINASTLPAGIALNGNHSNRILQVAVGANVVLDSLTLTNGKAADGIIGATGSNGGSNPGGPGGTGGPGASGGGIFNQGTLTLNRVTVSGNSAGNGGKGGNGGPGIIQGGGSGGSGGDGGAIYDSPSGMLNILNSTLANNNAGSGGNSGSGASEGERGSGGAGGGIANAGILSVTHATLTDNAAGARGNVGSGPPPHGNGGGIHTSGTLNLTNSLVALNTTLGVGPDVSGQATTIGGVNFIGNTNGASGLGTVGVNYLTGDPQLAPLGHYGGPTTTMTDDDNGIILRLDRPEDHAAFRKDVLEDSIRLSDPIGFGASLTVQRKHLMVSGSLDSSQWTGDLAARLLRVGRPFFFLPHPAHEALVCGDLRGVPYAGVGSKVFAVS